MVTQPVGSTHVCDSGEVVGFYNMDLFRVIFVNLRQDSISMNSPFGDYVCNLFQTKRRSNARDMGLVYLPIKIDEMIGKNTARLLRLWSVLFLQGRTGSMKPQTNP